MICCGLSDIGNFRENNEDSIFYAQKILGGVPICFGAVCDGVGGLRDGEVASRIISEQLKKWFGSVSGYSGDFSALTGSLLQRINRINASIIERSQIEDIQTGSTVAAVLTAGADFMALNVGDSRIYRVSGKISQISVDDVITDGEGRTKLSRCVGREENIYVNTVTGTVKPGDGFVICSDGFYKRIGDRRQKSMVKRSWNEKSCRKNMEKMIAFVKKKGERDNISAVIIRCTGKDGTAK